MGALQGRSFQGRRKNLTGISENLAFFVFWTLDCGLALSLPKARYVEIASI
jgi:hypothetical protein